MHEPDVRNMPDTPTGHVAYGPGRRALQQSATVQLPGEKDLFHARVPMAFIAEVFAVMATADQHTFQVLTKRPARMARLLGSPAFSSRVAAEVLGWRQQPDGLAVTWPLPNVWLGTSIENHRYTWRADWLRRTPAAVRFISAEPLLGPLRSLDLAGVDWLIAGGESGPDHRPIQPAWVRELRDRCLASGVAFFFKQWGGRTPKAGGRLLDGRTWDQLPARHNGGEAP